MKKNQPAIVRKVILALLALALAGCTSPSSNSGTFIKAPVLYGHAAKGSTGRSLIVNDSNDPTQVLGSDTLVPFSLSPVVTAWASSPVSGGGLSYTIFGQPVTVLVTQNQDGSTAFAGTIQGTNGSGIADDHNTCVFTVVLKADNSFTFEQAIWIRTNTIALPPDANAGDYLNAYFHTTGSGQVTNASGDFTGSGSEYKAEGFGSGIVRVHGITFHMKSVTGNIAILADTDYFVQTDSSFYSSVNPTPAWPVGQTGADTDFETTYPAPTTDSALGVQSEQVCGWFFASDNGIRQYVQSHYSGAAGYNDVGMGWGALISNISPSNAPGTATNAPGITESSAETVYGQPF